MGSGSNSLEFLNRVCDVLGLPKRTRSVNISADCRSRVVVKVEVLPDKKQVGELAAIIEEYELRKVEAKESRCAMRYEVCGFMQGHDGWFVEMRCCRTGCRFQVSMQEYNRLWSEGETK